MIKCVSPYFYLGLQGRPPPASFYKVSLPNALLLLLSTNFVQPYPRTATQLAHAEEEKLDEVVATGQEGTSLEGCANSEALLKS